jgi:hypothetical protein
MINAIAQGGNGTLDTIDAKEYCLNDPTRPVGYQIAQLMPQHAWRVRLHQGNDARLLPQIARPNGFDLAFIDADHQHPRPLLDLLRVAPFVRKSGWVLLHDIDLPRIAATHDLPGAAPAGAQWLFAQWPYPKISGGNIGAVKLPQNLRRIVPLALDMLSLPIEVSGSAGRRAVRAVLRAAASL